MYVPPEACLRTFVFSNYTNNNNPRLALGSQAALLTASFHSWRQAPAVMQISEVAVEEPEATVSRLRTAGPLKTLYLLLVARSRSPV